MSLNNDFTNDPTIRIILKQLIKITKTHAIIT